MIEALRNIAKLQVGLYTQPIQNGTVLYLQGRDFDDFGNYIGITDSRVEIKEKEKYFLLEEGDLIFASKGFRNFAWCYDPSIGPAIASTSFFVIKPNRDKVLPEYLTTLFNHTSNMGYFRQLGSGNAIPSIRIKELAEFKVKVLDLEIQRKIATLYQLHMKELSISQSLIQYRNELYNSVISKILK